MTDHQMSRRSALVGIGGTAVGAALSTSLLAMPRPPLQRPPSRRPPRRRPPRSASARQPAG